MKSLKNPMTNAIYIALITAIYAIIFIVSSEFVFKYDHFLSDSRWSLFIQNKNMKYVGLGMIGVAIIIDTFSALRRKKFDEYQIITLEKIMLFNGSFLNIIFPLSLFILIFVPAYFVETIFFFILFQWLCMIITEITYLINNKERCYYVVCLVYVGNSWRCYYRNNYFADRKGKYACYRF